MSATTEATVEPVASHVDLSWRGVYRAGGVCLLVVGLIYLAQVVLGALVSAPPDSQQFLQSLANHAGMAR
jgi:hypothetical protein